MVPVTSLSPFAQELVRGAVASKRQAEQANPDLEAAYHQAMYRALLRTLDEPPR